MAFLTILFFGLEPRKSEDYINNILTESSKEEWNRIYQEIAFEM